ncbi:MAG: hypothetical protein WCY72_00515 [Lysobacteraceae bacterium]
MNGSVSLQTEHVELVLAPYPAGPAVQLTVEPPKDPAIGDRPINFIVLTVPGARALAPVLRTVAASLEGDEPVGQSVRDQFCTCVVEVTSFNDGITVTIGANPPHAEAVRGVTLSFGLEGPDALRLAGLLETTALLADPAGGVA